VLGDNCTVAAGATVGPGAALGDDVEVAAGASIEAAAVLDRCSIGAGAMVRSAILSPDVSVGDDARISELAVVGSGVSVAAGSTLDDGAKVFAPGHGP
jgi:NDP-sugar pyrophosphorylase family protein